MVLPIVFAVLLGGAIGGGVFYFTREPTRVVRTQLDELRKGDLDAAHARLSEGYRAELSRSAFADFVQRHPGLHDNAESTFWSRSLVNDELRLSGTLTARSGAKERVSYLVVRERGEWKVARIRFEP